LGLRFRAVAADTGAIGGTGSHEFHVLADSGEDAIAYSPDSDYAANIELAEAVAPRTPRPAPSEPLRKVATPGQKTIDEVSRHLGVPPERIVKSLLVIAGNGREYLLLLRGDHTLNEIKASKVLSDFRFATETEVRGRFNAGPGSIGPVATDVLIVADRAVTALADFVCGANDEGHHFTGVNLGRDLPELSQIADLRNVVAGDPSPDGKGHLEICRGIEVGHIFQLGTKYAAAMGATVLDEHGQSRPMEMGCYGIGVSRIVAAAIEQSHDARGIAFPQTMAPFAVAIVPIGVGKSAQVADVAQRLHDALEAADVEVLLDDRDERPGVMFADMELIGIPHRIVVGERGLKQGVVEYQGRRDAAATPVPVAEAVAFVRSRVCDAH
jgi:prolyl-tRNA synthetase